MKANATGRRRRAAGERGAAMVELAIILPLLMLLVFGIIEFGRLYNAQVTLTHGAREAVRDYAIHQDLGQADGIARDAIASTMFPGPLSVTNPDGCTAGDPATIALEYPFQLQIPFYGDRAITLNAEGVMRCGG